MTCKHVFQLMIVYIYMYMLIYITCMQFGFNELEIALMFAILPVVYFVCAIITGCLSDKLVSSHIP